MIRKIRTSRFSKVIAVYMAMQLILTIVQPGSLYALTGGPSQPEFNSFTPIGTSDMVGLSSGDFNYNIPIMDVGGYPLNLAYNSGITMDQEASWVGLGWNLNVGQISRQVRGIPDDFNGDLMNYQNDMKENITIGTNVGISGSLFGFPKLGGLSLGMGVQYNNYEGITFHPSYGVSFSLNNNVQVGMNFSSSTTEGATVSPKITLSAKDKGNFFNNYDLDASLGVSMNSRKGMENLNFSASMTRTKRTLQMYSFFPFITEEKGSGSVSGSISLNNNNVYTPYKRAGMKSGNFSFNASLGSEVLGLEAQGYIQGFGSFQSIRGQEKNKNIPAYGYSYSEYADKGNSILDFTREKDRSFNKNTTVLPIPNFTYDIYTIQGQGVGGMFRPHRGQITYLADNTVTDLGIGGSFGVEFGAGWNVHTGVDTEESISYSYTGGWTEGNYTLNLLKEKNTDDNALDYEQVYYKLVGETNIDSQYDLYNNAVHSNKAMTLLVDGTKHGRTLLPVYKVKDQAPNGTPTYTNMPLNTKIKRSQRNKRNSTVYPVSNMEAVNDALVHHRSVGNTIKPHHIVGYKVLQPEGSHYIYGETAYNWSKEEITVDVSNANGVNCEEGTIVNSGNVQGLNTSDHYLNKITTPAYAHSYLLSSILSSDYEDLTGNGPSEDDLGSYTLFNYGTDSSHYVSNYSWRTPYQTNLANYNEGLKSLHNDQKGSIIKGEKELRYIRTIETKTHIAYFRLSDREDGKESGGNDRMKKIDQIFLYTKPEFTNLITEIGGIANLESTDVTTLSKNAIKTAHFEYNYSLCPGVPNSTATEQGKLTLSKLYFTYRDSNMGKFTPYTFNYSSFNPSYNLKGYDIWGNYKDNTGTGCGINDALTTAEYPFVNQDKTEADLYTSAWILSSIDLPSGGKMEITTESDDYQYVQDRKAMQMFKIKGFGHGNIDYNSQLYGITGHKTHVYVNIDNSITNGEDFLNSYLSENAYKPIYFRALLNMVKNTDTQYDYVSGYFEIDPGSDGVITGNDFNVFSDNNGTMVAIPMRMLDKEGGLINSSTDDTNPIAKAGWYYGRTNLNRVVYSIGGEPNNTNFISIVKELVSSLGAVFEIFSGPNGKLEEKGCAKIFIPEKSWIRLENPNSRKLGGGLRVKQITLQDQWDKMDFNNTNDDSFIYKQFYGQVYNYDLENGTSSGVATYEPNASPENPFVEPFYDNQGNKKDQLVAPKESNFVEMPLGDSFFPSAMVTYSRVTVKNLPRENNGNVVSKHATGKVVNEFYTSKDFPTVTDYTQIFTEFDPPGPLSNIFNLDVKNHITFSQGFVVETNDMNGRQKSQRVYPEGQETFISGVDYIYNITDEGKLSSTVNTLNKLGEVSENEVGLSYDVVNDFRENFSESTTVGVNFNVAGFVIFIVPVIVPLPIPDFAHHENKLRTTATVKVIHRTAILKEKIAYDLGATVSTKNLAWDEDTGQVLLTETVNEYNNHYFNFTYPAHWYYKGMGMAYKNIGIQGQLTKEQDQHNIVVNNLPAGTNPNTIFFPGDELETNLGHFWVAKIEPGNITLMDDSGNLFNDNCDGVTIDFKIVRSGYRNLQTASMASVTAMINPIDIDNDGTLNNLSESSFLYQQNSAVNPRIVNASAVEYGDAWKLQWENNLPPFPSDLETLFEDMNYGGGLGTEPEPYLYGFNPYLYNVRAEWRAKRSYAYLTARESHLYGEASPRYEGFFKRFNPFYTLDNTGTWVKDTNNWTFASKVTQYSPYGTELENQDALGRYSAAQYGYAYNLPVAVAANSAYQEIGFDGFEDYNYANTTNDPHFGFPNTSPTQGIAHTGDYSLAVTGETALSLDYTQDCYIEVDYSGADDCNTGGGDDPIICNVVTVINQDLGLACGSTIVCSFGFDGTIQNDVWITGGADGNIPFIDNIILGDSNGYIVVGYECNISGNCSTGVIQEIDHFRVQFRVNGVLYAAEVIVNNTSC